MVAALKTEYENQLRDTEVTRLLSRLWEINHLFSFLSQPPLRLVIATVYSVCGFVLLAQFQFQWRSIICTADKDVLYQHIFRVWDQLVGPWPQGWDVTFPLFDWDAVVWTPCAWTESLLRMIPMWLGFEKVDFNCEPVHDASHLAQPSAQPSFSLLQAQSHTFQKMYFIVFTSTVFN